MESEGGGGKGNDPQKKPNAPSFYEILFEKIISISCCRMEPFALIVQIFSSRQLMRTAVLSEPSEEFRNLLLNRFYNQQR